MKALSMWLATGLLLVAGNRPAHAADAEIPSGFFVSKSENKNQVHYAVRVDASCVPAGEGPIRAYWRNLERGPSDTSPLLGLEQPAYGVADQRVLSRDATGGVVRFTLRALPTRVLTVRVTRTDDGTCRATTSAMVGGFHVDLYNAHIVLRFLGVDSLILSGTAHGTGRLVREVVKPRA